MRQRDLYLILAVVGFTVSIYFVFSLVAAGGSNARALLHELFGTRISAFFAVDLILSSVVFIRYLRKEVSRYCMRRRWFWFCLAGLFTLGLAFALPLFLYAREWHIDTKASGR
ncbi:MAG TPA: DUF2834 domain-containing protein [Blastocatellia bacterium]